MTDPRDIVKEQFGAHARDYVTSTVHAQGESLARVVELARPQHDWVALDVSTGAGHTALAFAPFVTRVVATDLTPQMLDAARRLAADRHVANVEFRPADAHTLPFDDDTFHLVTNRIALHHYPDPPRAVGEMARVCRSGGIVALVDNTVPADKQTSDYINDFERLRDPSHHMALPAARLEAHFADVGLRVEHRECLRKHMDFEPWATRMGAGDGTRARLRTLLLDAPAGAREFLAPRTEGGRLRFTLTEIILIGRKP